MHAKRKNDAGLSLLEITVVLAIIALVVGLAAPRIIDSFGRAKSQVARIQMSNLKGALQLFYIDVGRYPSEAEGLTALNVAPQSANNWSGPYIDKSEGVDDPWGRPYFYRYPGQDGAFDLYTLGRDGQAGGAKEDSDINL